MRKRNGSALVTRMRLQAALGKTWDVLSQAVRPGFTKLLFVMAITKAARLSGRYKLIAVPASKKARISQKNVRRPLE